MTTVNTLVQVWNKFTNLPTDCTSQRYFLQRLLEGILEEEFKSEIGYREVPDDDTDREVVLLEKPLTGLETVDVTTTYPKGFRIPEFIRDSIDQITLNDFRTYFDWDEEYKVRIVYPYTIQSRVIETFQPTSKEEVRELMSGRNTYFDHRHNPFKDEHFESYDLDHGEIYQTYSVSIRNLRLKETVVIDKVRGTK